MLNERAGGFTTLLSLTLLLGAKRLVVRDAIAGVTRWLLLTLTVGAKRLVAKLRTLGITVFGSRIVGATRDVVRLATFGVTETHNTNKNKTTNNTQKPLGAKVMVAVCAPVALTVLSS